MTITTLLNRIVSNIINPAIVLLMAIAVIVFLWTVFKFITKADSPDRKKNALGMMWSLIGLFIMISVYGIVNLVISFISR